MSKNTPVFVTILLTLLLPFCSYGFGLNDSPIHLRAEIISFFNISLFVTALISIKQFFWPGGNNTMPFHIFNIVFVLLFYGVSLPFLISNRQYYDGYENLTPLSVLGKFFLSLSLSSIGQWFIVASFFFNFLYINRYRKDYYRGGTAEMDDVVEENEDIDDVEKEEDN